MTEAAKAAGVDRRMITRRLDAEMFPNAYRSDGKSGPGSGPWMIPTDDLIAAGLQLDLPSSPDEPEPTASEVEMLKREIDHLRQRLADKDAHLTDARAALAMALQQVGAGPSPASATNTGGPEGAAEAAPAPVTAFDMLDSTGPSFWGDAAEGIRAEAEMAPETFRGGLTRWEGSDATRASITRYLTRPIRLAGAPEWLPGGMLYGWPPMENSRIRIKQSEPGRPAAES